MTIDATRGARVRRRYRQDARRDRRLHRRSSAAEDRGRGGRSRRRIPPVRQRESRRGAHRQITQDERGGGQRPGSRSSSRCRWASSRRQQGRRRFHVHRRAVADRRRCRRSRSSMASWRSPSTTCARATSPWKSSADRRRSLSRPATASTRITGSGTLTIAALRREYAKPRISIACPAAVDWTVAVDVLRPGTLAWVLESSMKGASVDLPAPLGKAAASDAVAHRAARRRDAGRHRLRHSRPTARRAARRAPQGRRQGGATIDRALLSLGSAIERSDAARAERPGLWVRAELPALNVDDWIALLRAKPELTESGRQKRGSRLRAPISMSDSSMRSACAFTDLKLRDARSAVALDIRSRRAARSPARRTGLPPDAGLRTDASSRGLPASRFRVAAASSAWRRAEKQGERRRRESGRRRRQSVARDRRRRRLAAVEGARSRASRARRTAARRRMADRSPGARQRQRAARGRRGMARAGPRSSRRSSTSSSTRRMRAASLRDSDIPMRCRVRRRRSTVSSHGPARRTSSTSHRSTGMFRIDVGPGRFTQHRARPGQAARRAVAAGAAATRDARLPRRLQRRLRVRRDRRQRAHRERRDDDEQPEARRVPRPRSTSPAKPISRRKRSGSRCACSRRCRRASPRARRCCSSPIRWSERRWARDRSSRRR